VLAAVRPDTLLVSVIQVNNETGVEQPLEAIAEGLASHECYLHTDAAQGFGKRHSALRNPRVDMISVSGHKIYAPKGIGALILRKRGYEKTPLAPLMHGGGQERGLRPGTLPVALIVALGEAAELAAKESERWAAKCASVKCDALAALSAVGGIPVGNQELVLPSTLNIQFPGLDSEALIVGLQGIAAISNGSACTSSSYKPSHVLKAMGMDDASANKCVRLSWSHLTPPVDWGCIAARIQEISR
jgi:cysteine desulfurase